MFGERIEVKVLSKGVYPIRPFEIPFVVRNTGLLDLDFDLTFTLKRISQNALMGTSYRDGPWCRLARIQFKGEKEEREMLLASSSPSQTEEVILRRRIFLPKGEAIEGSLLLDLLEIHNGLVIEEEKRDLLLSPSFEVVGIEGLEFNVGEDGVISFLIRNRGTCRGEATLHLRLIDILDEKRRIFLSPFEEGNVSFSFFVQDDYEGREYEGEYSLNGEEGSFRFRIKGIEIDVSPSLDKRIYRKGDIAEFKIRIKNLNQDILPNLYPMVKLGGYEERRDFLLDRETTLSFDIPVGGEEDKIGYGIYTQSGRSIHLNTMYLRMAGERLSIWLDEDVYHGGDLVMISYLFDDEWLSKMEEPILRIMTDIGFSEDVKVLSKEGVLGFKIGDGIKTKSLIRGRWSILVALQGILRKDKGMGLSNGG